MFEVAKFAAEFKTKIIIGLVLFLVVGGLAGGAWYSWKDRGNTIESQKKDLVIKGIENGGLKETVKDQVEASVITEKINTEIVVEKEKIVQKHDKIKNKVAYKVKVIEDDYSKLPQTPENAEAMDTQTSTVMIEGLWESFCTASPDSEKCTVPQSTALI